MGRQPSAVDVVEQFVWSVDGGLTDWFGLSTWYFSLRSYGTNMHGPHGVSVIAPRPAEDVPDHDHYRCAAF